MQATQHEPVSISAVLDKSGGLNVTILNATYGLVTHIFFGVVNDAPGLTDHGPVPGWGPEALAAVQKLADGIVAMAELAPNVLQQPSYNLLVRPGARYPVPLPCAYLAERIGTIEDALANDPAPNERVFLEHQLAVLGRLYAEEGCTSQQ